MTRFTPGSLVSARGRDWVVLPPEEDGWLLLRPLSGMDAEIVALSPELEEIRPAAFALPDPDRAGDASLCALLRDAVRLGLRATTGPFRSFGRIAVEPRPYQLVPLLMAMRQPVVRLLIADDVGIGKTVEAMLIARELLDRGEIRRLAVLCPPPLAEQWQEELASKFHIDAVRVLPSTVGKLERGLGAAVSLFERYPFTVVSLDYIKSERRKMDFLRACPEFVIVDEAHTCASAAGSAGSMQRCRLVGELAKDTRRHMVFVTATPHSGREDAFRTLLGFLDPAFANLPGQVDSEARKRLARQIVQRRRGDISRYMDAGTPFPERKAMDVTWKADTQWKAFFQKARNLARKSLDCGAGGDERQKRVSFWAALTLLRCVSSSPAAAIATLNTRAAGLEEDEQDSRAAEAGRRQMAYDEGFGEGVDDAVPGSNLTAPAARTAGGRLPAARLYHELAALAEDLKGARDAKLMTIVPHLKTLLEAGFSPVVFCRFIATAEYLTDKLRGCLPGCSVECVTGTLPPDERAARVEALAAKPARVLVCTDCLSEGINLQSAFDAVIHYDLSWNPTRHEQREGRVDRFGQSASEVRVITFWGEDSPVDRRIIEVLLRKHRAIRDQLGVSVPVPQNYDLLLETLIRDDLMTQPAGRSSSRQLTLPGLKLSPGRRQADAGRGLKALHAAWDEAAALVRRGSNTVFAQRGIHVEEVAGLWARTAEAMGLSGTVAAFARKAWERLGGVITDEKDGSRPAFTVFFSEDVRRRHPGLDLPADRTRVVFEQPARPGEIYLCRTHAWVESLAAYLSRSALDRAAAAPLVARCGVMRTRAVNERVILLLCRFRFLLRAGGAVGHAALAEECACLALNGITSELRPLPQDRISSLLQAEPGGNVDAGQGRRILKQVLQAAPSFLPLVRAWRTERAGALLEEHCRAREAAKARGPRCSVEPQGEPDILGVYVYLPVVQ